MDRVYEKGDLFYRFKFSLDGHVTTDIFVVTNVHISNSIRIRLEPIDEDSNTSFKQGISFYSKGNIGVVKTKSLNKYIMLDENDEQEARRILNTSRRKETNTSRGWSRPSSGSWSRREKTMTDILLALWAVSLCVVAAFAYFKGAKDQLNSCIEQRMEQWSIDEIWGKR